MKIYYRISDFSYQKTKLGDKKLCLHNFTQVFKDYNITIIADNVYDESFNYLKSTYSNYEIIRTHLSNAHSFRFAMNLAISGTDEEIYFIEDDYIHNPNFKCGEILKEGLARADYVTLYDHPDKYQIEYQFGETTKVLRTANSHWKFTCSTTMTFAARRSALIRDTAIFDKYTQGNHPHDHIIFLEIGPSRLLSSVPGLACHMDLTYSCEKGVNLLDTWAVDYVNSIEV